MAGVERRRIVKRREPPPKVEKKYVCPACHGTVSVTGRRDITSIRAIHESTCPAHLRVVRK